MMKIGIVNEGMSNLDNGNDAYEKLSFFFSSWETIEQYFYVIGTLPNNFARLMTKKMWKHLSFLSDEIALIPVLSWSNGNVICSA